MTAVAEKKPDESKLVVPDQREERSSPHAQPAPSNLMQALATAAASPQMDVGKVKELYAMHKEMMDRAAETAYNDAMAKCQAEILPVATNAFNDHTKSGYAKLEAIDRLITPIHTRHGFSISYGTETKNEADPIPEGYLRIVATVRHSAGHKTQEHIDLPPDDAGAKGNTNKTMVQAIGSTNTYARRYLKLMVFNVSTFDDKDGNRSKGGGGTMDEKKLADHFAAIEAGATEADMLRAFSKAYNEAADLKDKDTQRVLMAKRDECAKAIRQRGRR